MKFMKLKRLSLITALTVGCLTGATQTPASAQQGEIIIRTAPPAPRAEVRGSVRAGYEWVPGYWRWEGRRHVWVGGHWERVRRGYYWEPARWDRRGGGWVFIPGRWVRGDRRTPPPPPDYDDGRRYGDGPRHDGPRHDGPYDRDRRGPGRRYWERQGWVLLGEQTVSGNQDHDEVYVGRRQGRFSRVLLVVEDGDIELHDILITFTNGRSWSPRMRHYFRENQRSRTMILPNAPRSLRSVRLHYGNADERGRWRNRGRARVEVWAR